MLWGGVWGVVKLERETERECHPSQFEFGRFQVLKNDSDEQYKFQYLLSLHIAPFREVNLASGMRMGLKQRT